MQSESDERLLRQSYSEIIHGFSIKSNPSGALYIKHFSTLDNLEVDFLYTEKYNTSVSKGYPTETDRLKQLDKDRLWTTGDENNLEAVRVAIRGFLIAKKKVFLKRDIDSINSQIKEQEEVLEKMLEKRENLIGATAEKSTRRSVDSYLISKSFFKDIALQHPLYTQEEFDELDRSELDGLFNSYNSVMENFSELNIKKMALSSFFQNAFYLTDSVYEFYGKPICFLTNFQIQLAAYGSFYKSILSSEVKPPEELLNDPDKLEDWHSGKTNADQMLEKAGGDENANVAVFGASQEDFKNWGYEHQQQTSLVEATKAAGGMLDMEAMMKLQGVI